jgi:hypothetical protein
VSPLFDPGKGLDSWRHPFFFFPSFQQEILQTDYVRGDVIGGLASSNVSNREIVRVIVRELSPTPAENCACFPLISEGGCATAPLNKVCFSDRVRTS